MSDEELVLLIQNGIDVQKNMELLYKQCYKYVKKIVYPYSTHFKTHSPGTTGVFEINDLMNEAYFSLCKAIKKYDEGKGKFIAFAASFIKLDMKRFIESSSLVHVPVNQSNLMWRYSLLLRRQEVLSGENLSDEWFADELGISTDKFHELKKLFQVGTSLSLDMKGVDDEDGENGDLHGKLTEGENPESYVIDSIAAEELSSIWDKAEKVCNEKEVMILKEHYLNNASFREIGEQMGKCGEIARRHHVKALEKLKQDEEIQKIAEVYFDDYDCRSAYHYTVARFKNTGESSTEYIAMKHLSIQMWLQPDKLEQIKKWKNMGFNKTQIAEKIGIHRVTLARWCSEYEQIRNAFKTESHT